MTRYPSTAAMVAAVSLAATTANAEWLGFCGNYQQVTSTAGDCLECRLIIADNPEIQFYGVESNTGWSAELTWVEGDESVAQGAGHWGNVGGAYGGQNFDIDLVRQGDFLDMRMTHHAASLPGTIKARFVCRD